LKHPVFIGVVRIASVMAIAGWSLAAHGAEPLTIFGAGSLREAITQIGQAFEKDTGIPVKTAFGYSGTMRERIEKGEHADILASADMGHPEKLRASGLAIRVVVFTRNTLCAVALPKVGLTADNLLEKMLDANLIVGIFPPKVDPVGDYSIAMFGRADKLKPGALATLESKAKILSPSLSGSPVAAGADYTPGLLRDGVIDIHIAYCSGARTRLAAAIPDLTIVDVPAAYRVGPEYGMAIMKNAAPQSADLALFIMSPEAQAILRKNGFTPVALPEGR
jgi:molybdate transport system substrate-binding protein